MVKLYKQDSKGRLRIWSGWTANDQYFLATGLVGGKMNESKPVTCTAKNIGRSNETTPAFQAIFELNSKYAKKLDEGYYKTKAEALANKTILPMLAYKYETSRVDWKKSGAYISRKLDGHRMLAHCHANGVDLITRKGKAYTTLKHIEKDLKNVYDTYGDCWLDGEVYVHGQTFQENTKLIKKYRPGQTDTLSYQVYDIVLSTKNVSEREDELKTIFSLNTFTHVKHVIQYLLHSEEEMREKFSEFIAEGYEGIMIKVPHYGYQVDKRSHGLLKYKEFIDAEFEVVDIIPAPRRTTHGVVVLKHSDGREFQANLKDSWEAREELLTNKQNYIGKWATIEFFEETDSGLPRFPVLHGFRVDDVKND
jgi:ATP-dependent DNA ligase